MNIRMLPLASCALALALSLLTLPVAVAADYEPVSVSVDAQEITTGVWMIEGQIGVASSVNEGFNSNAGFVVTDDGVVVFDALGTPSLGAQMIKEIRRVTDKPIERLIISHYHSDHFYGAQAFTDQGIPVTAHKWVTENYLKSDAPSARLIERRQSLFPWVNESSKITQPDELISDEVVFTVGGLTFRVFHTGPAHTPEDLMMYVEELGVLFAGDLIFSGRLPWVGNADSKTWLEAIDTLEKLAPLYLVPGHGSFSDQAQVDLALTRKYLRYLRLTMGAAVEELVEFDEVYGETDWSAFEGLPTFNEANRSNAYNTYLLMQRELFSN